MIAYMKKLLLLFEHVSKPFIWFVVVCMVFGGVGHQARNALAYQSDELTPTPSLESTVTLPVEEQPQPLFTNTPTDTLQVTATEISDSIFLSSLTPTSTPIPTEVLPLPVLSGEFVSNEVVIRFKRAATSESIQYCFSLVSGTVLSLIEELGAWIIQVPSGHVAESIAVISTCPNVRYVEPNYTAFIADTIPFDPNWNFQYGLINIRAPQGWDYSTGSNAVTIAIIDSGVDLGHADLAAKIVPGYDFVNGDSIAQDDNGHGTHVAGIAAASGNNGIGIAGVSWGARIMPIKVLNAAGGGSFADVAAGIIWATDNGAQVINLSLGGASSSVVLQDAVNYAYGKGVVLVAAAGNTGTGMILYPARYANVIAVGAVDITNSHAGFSNFGPELDIVAPGASIYSTVIGGYDYKSGTSMAAPYVSGVAAILRGYPAGYSPSAIALEIESSALDLGAPGLDSFYGYGLIQMDRAIQLVYPTTTPTNTQTSTFGNQFLLPNHSPVSTWTPTSTPSPTVSITPTNSKEPVETPSKDALQGQATATSELNALSTPQAGHGFLYSTFALPCLGVFLILLGVWLFIIVGRKQNHPRKRM